jgi:hypothetical protein
MHTGETWPAGEEAYDEKRERSRSTRSESDHSDSESDHSGSEGEEAEESEGGSESEDDNGESESDIPESALPAVKKRKDGQTRTTHVRCQHCLKPNHEEFCVHCFHRTDLAFDHPQNVHIRAQQRLATGTDTVNSTPSSSGGKLSKRDGEFERLACAGEDFPRFRDTSSVSSFAALKISKEAHMATSFAPASSSLLKLIRSGKLIDVGWALPISVGDAAAESADGPTAGTLKIGADGQVKAHHPSSAPPIKSMHQFMQALVCTILPALAEQPPALFDWIALTRTLLALDNEGRNWNRAKRYLERVLVHRVYARQEFGTLDRSILLAVQDESLADTSHRRERSGTPATPAAAGASSARGGGQPAHKASTREKAAGTRRTCMQYNSDRGCAYPSCRYAHVCSRPNCGGGHPATHCDLDPSAREKGRGRTDATAGSGAKHGNLKQEEGV